MMDRQHDTSSTHSESEIRRLAQEGLAYLEGLGDLIADAATKWCATFGEDHETAREFLLAQLASDDLSLMDDLTAKLLSSPAGFTKDPKGHIGDFLSIAVPALETYWLEHGVPSSRSPRDVICDLINAYPELLHSSTS